MSIADFWKRKFTLTLFTLLGIAAGLIYLKSTAPSFETQARVLIQPVVLVREGQALPSVNREFLPTQSETIRSPRVVQDAIQNITVALPPGVDPANFEKVRYVVDALTVTPVLNANVVTVNYRGYNREEGAHIISSVIDAYKNHIKRESVHQKVQPSQDPPERAKNNNIQVAIAWERSQQQVLAGATKNHQDFRERIESLDKPRTDLRIAKNRQIDLERVLGPKHPDRIAIHDEVRDLEQNLVFELLRVLEPSDYSENSSLEELDSAIKEREQALISEIEAIRETHADALIALREIRPNPPAAPPESLETSTPIKVEILDGPVILDEMEWPKPKQLIVASGFVGLLLGVMFVWLQKISAASRQTNDDAQLAV